MTVRRTALRWWRWLMQLPLAVAVAAAVGARVMISKFHSVSLVWAKENVCAGFCRLLAARLASL